MPWNWCGINAPTAVASGDLTFSEPAGSEEGDLFVASITYRSTTAFTLPALWEIVDVQLSGGNTTVNGTGSIASGLMAYIVRGSSAPDLVFERTGGDMAIGTLLSYRGGKLVGVYDTGRAELIAAQSTSITLPAITTANAEELLVMMAALARNTTASAFDAVTAPTVASGATNTTSEPTLNTWLERNDRGSTSGADGAIAVADAIKTASGTTGQLSYTAAAAARHAQIVGAFIKETAYPEFRSDTGIASTGGTTSNITLDNGMPTGWQAGDVFVMVMVAPGPGAAAGVPNGSGWTKVGSTIPVASTGSATCYTRTALSSDTASNLESFFSTADVVLESWSIVYCFNNTSGVEAAASTEDSSVNTTGTGRTLTTLGDNRLVVNIGVTGATGTISVTGWMNLSNDNGTNGRSLCAARPKAIAASVTGATFTLGSAQISACFGFALKPILASAPPPFVRNPMQHMLVR